jgi:FkbM family methyltransferase
LIGVKRTPLKQTLYDGSKAMAQKTAARFGFELQRAGHEVNSHAQRAILLDRLGVSLVLDVGANLGQYAAVHLRRYSHYAGRVVSFEPVAESYAQCARAALSDPNWDVLHYGLSNARAVLPIRVPLEQTDMSSLQRATVEGSRMMAGRRIELEDVELERLDDVIDEVAGPADVLGLKLDVQGHEASVLEGAERSLERVALLECELPLVRLYEGQETFRDLLSRIQAKGFVPVGIKSNYLDRTSGFVMDADVLFVQGDQTDAD